MRRYLIDEMDNMRDLGGYAIGKNAYVKYGLLIRSNVPTKLTEESLAELKDKGFSTIIDLRSDEENAHKPGSFKSANIFNFYHIGMNGDGRIPKNKNEVLNSYIEILDGKNQIKKVFDTIANADGGVIYYCNAGKDRTGVISALILKLLGVNDKEVAVDYVASKIFLKEMLEKFADSMKDQKDIKEIIVPNENTMFNLLKYIKEQYQSVENYLKICEVSEENINKIKQKYIAKY